MRPRNSSAPSGTTSETALWPWSSGTKRTVSPVSAWITAGSNTIRSPSGPLFSIRTTCSSATAGSARMAAAAAATIMRVMDDLLGGVAFGTSCMPPHAERIAASGRPPPPPDSAPLHPMTDVAPVLGAFAQAGLEGAGAPALRVDRGEGLVRQDLRQRPLVQIVPFVRVDAGRGVERRLLVRARHPAAGRDDAVRRDVGPVHRRRLAGDAADPRRRDGVGVLAIRLAGAEGLVHAQRRRLQRPPLSGREDVVEARRLREADRID